MEINITLIVQMLVFLVFVIFTAKLVWPPLEKALEERRDKIADGLSAAERGRRELELAQHRVKDELKQAKVQAAEIIDKANKLKAKLIEDAKEEAKREAKIQTKLAEEQLVQQVNQARQELKDQTAQLAVQIASKILAKQIDPKLDSALLDEFIEET